MSTSPADTPSRKPNRIDPKMTPPQWRTFRGTPSETFWDNPCNIDAMMIVYEDMVEDERGGDR